MNGDVVLSAWITGPICAVLFACVLVHLSYLAPRVQPASRRRIRTASGAVLLIVLPLVCVGFSVLAPARQPTAWALTWIAASTLTGLAAFLALLDIVNTMRLHRNTTKRLNLDMGALRGRWASGRGGAVTPPPPTGGGQPPRGAPERKGAPGVTDRAP